VSDGHQYTIGEFSMMSRIPVRTLRFYHEQQVLVPAAIDPQTGYRSYDHRNLEVAQLVSALRALEFPLDDIREILADCRNDDDLLGHLQRQRASLAEKFRRTRDILSKIDHLLAQQHSLEKENQMRSTNSEISEYQIEPMLVAGIRMTGAYSDCGAGFALLGKRLGRHIAGEPLCLFYDGEFRDGDANFEPCFPIRKAPARAADGIDVRELPGGRCLTLVHRGPYEELSRSYARLLEHAKKSGRRISLPTREVYHKGPGMFFCGNPKKYVTEIQLPIET
jgi:DNA-binding transcriptional MerR regulator/effector-binding domain-containing protein